MTLTVFMFLAGGILIGGSIAWLYASSRFSKKIAELEIAAGSAEALRDEFKNQTERARSELDQIRKKLDDETRQKIKSQTELNASLENLAEQKTMIETIKTEMKDTFNALSSAALQSSSKEFLQLASEHLGKVVADTKGKLGEHQSAMDGLLKPLHDALKRYDEQLRALESKRRQDYGGIEEQIKMLSLTHRQLQKETSSLVNALRKPQVSGSWGQLSLRRASELAGMTVHCDFQEEVSVSTDTGRLRPDMLVRLPNGRVIVVDAKAPVDAYLNAISASSEEEKEKKLAHYVSQVRAHMNSLGSKSYWEQFPESPEIVVMYLPGESFFSAALEYDSRLIEDSTTKKVILATPTTFIALLKAIAYGWQQDQITKNARRVSNSAKELYDRINTMVKHLDDVGSAFTRTIVAYNKAVGSLESRVLPSIRKFKDLGVTGGDDIPVIEQINQNPRDITLANIKTDVS